METVEKLVNRKKESKEEVEKIEKINYIILPSGHNLVTKDTKLERERPLTR